ncbi:hypothetical protein [Paenibacillus guangzhouensis]|uniref:hypothetical protein n=1 Tax=Paenibacillus guangzhouensis TaxID=1473112 RepID=UPI001266BBF8|nr:hypothetical protein [Paenibacillus guangzhouensis]
MVPVLGILASTILIAMIEIPHLLKNNLTRELWIFMVLLLLGTIGWILKSLHLYLPNPFDLMIIMFRPFSELLFGLLE